MNYSVEVSIHDKMIDLKTFMEHHGIMNQVTRQMIDTQDQAVRQALIALGWTPPQEGGVTESGAADNFDAAIESARLLGSTQAAAGFGKYTQDDSRFERAMYESIARRRRRAVLQDKLCAAVRQLLDEIDGLIGESQGVYGLHLNGDSSPWEELLSGGSFERLTSLESVRSLLPITNQGEHHAT